MQELEALRHENRELVELTTDLEANLEKFSNLLEKDFIEQS